MRVRPWAGRHRCAGRAGATWSPPSGWAWCIGFYDGLLGPGTGTFLVIGLVAVLGYAFLEASAKAKIVNAATNLGALAVFTLQGAPLWKLGLLVGAANIAGAYLGARMAVAKGSRFVRVVFMVVVGALIVRLGWDVVAP